MGLWLAYRYRYLKTAVFGHAMVTILVLALLAHTAKIATMIFIGSLLNRKANNP